ncbi:hypothetical protein DPEC_G00179940 [Dallia pectoralis]|uniref:Uncharacterized protein n=1 Tax=Dallia pectoralis TaxID=75939 RepID=A0ACC2G9Q0_DALPE|nr:hypothetical protein DPEC_G00179940 [Dallia pectoralis]
MTSQAVLGSSPPGQNLKKEKLMRDPCSAPNPNFNPVGTPSVQENIIQPSDHSNDRIREKGEKKRNWERKRERRREHPGNRSSAHPEPNSSSSDGEAWQEARSWRREKAKRGRRHCGSNRDKEAREMQGGERGEREKMDLQSIGSDDGKKDVSLENGSGVENRRSKKDGGRSSQRQEMAGSMSHSLDGSTSLVEEAEKEGPITKGSLMFIHPDCLNQWIKSSDTRCCELCQYYFIMETHLKPLHKWEKLQMSTNERRKIWCSVMFHMVSISCVLWSLYVLIHRTLHEINMGRNTGQEHPNP